MASMASLIDTAYGWHGGQSSPLYSFASTGGTVHSEEHRGDLAREIARCLREIIRCEDLSPRVASRETRRLKALAAHVAGAAIKARLT